MQVISELKELGLDDNEIKIYLACLNLGSAKVNEISKRSELIRTTAYGVLRSLINKGLVSTILKDNITYFQAASPKELINILEEKKRKLASILPALEKLSKSIPPSTKVEYFEGKNGLKTIFNDLISKPNQTYKLIGGTSNWLNFSPSYVSMFYQKKRANKIKSMVINSEEEKEAVSEVLRSKQSEIKNSNFKFIKNFKFNGTIYIYHDKVGFNNYEEGNAKGVIIQDAEFNKILNMMFDNLWKLAEK